MPVKTSLTYRESADRELEAVTPNMFLRNNENTVPLLKLNYRDFAHFMPASRERRLRIMQMRDECLDKFRELWYDEYLLSVRKRSQGHTQKPFKNRQG